MVREKDSRRVLDAHHRILAHVRTYWTEPIAKKMNGLHAGYMAAGPEDRMRLFEEVAGRFTKGPRAWFALDDDGGGFWCFDERDFDDVPDDLYVCWERRDYMFGILGYELASEPVDERILTVVAGGSFEDLPEGHNPTYIAACAAMDLVRLIPTMDLCTACEFIVTGVFPDTDLISVVPRMLNSRIVGYTVNIAAGKVPENALGEALKDARKAQNVWDVDAFMEDGRSGGGGWTDLAVSRPPVTVYTPRSTPRGSVDVEKSLVAVPLKGGRRRNRYTARMQEIVASRIEEYGGWPDKQEWESIWSDVDDDPLCEDRYGSPDYLKRSYIETLKRDTTYRDALLSAVFGEAADDDLVSILEELADDE